MSKSVGVFIRLSEAEKALMAEKAAENGLSLSEYIRVRILENQEAVSSYKKEMSIYGVIAYYVLGQMAKKRLTPDEIAEARARANKVLKKWHMSEED